MRDVERACSLKHKCEIIYVLVGKPIKIKNSAYDVTQKRFILTCCIIIALVVAWHNQQGTKRDNSFLFMPLK